MCSIADCLKRAVELSPVSDTARLDVEVILAWVLAKDRTYLFTWPEKVLDQQQLHQFERAFSLRLAGEPVAHITGEREFWSLSFLTSKATLIPRPDTEHLVERSLDVLNSIKSKAQDRPLSLLDLGTGTGAIAISIAHEMPDVKVEAVDKFPEAVELARQNSQRLKTHNVHVFQSDWFTNVTGKYDIIVSNPPYIDEDDEHLSQGDVRFEPDSALVSPNKGLGDIAIIAEQARQYLVQGGFLCVEHGWKQGAEVRQLFREAGFNSVESGLDFAGNERITWGLAKLKVSK